MVNNPLRSHGMKIIIIHHFGSEYVWSPTVFHPHSSSYADPSSGSTEIPSWQLRYPWYPSQMHFRRWFSFSPGGNMSSFPEVYHQNFFSKSKNPILHAAPNVFQRTRRRVAGMMVLIAAGQWNVPWETVGIGLPIFNWFLVHVMFQS